MPMPQAKILKRFLFVAIVCTLFAFDFDEAEGWFKAGSAPGSYDMGIDKGAGPNGTNAASIKSIKKKIDGFGTLMQNSIPDKYKGKKVRMIGSIKSKDVDGWAGLWLRVDEGKDKAAKSYALDNMYERAVKGTTEWTKYELVLDVPEKATNISFGALLHGVGQIWFDDISFEVAENTVPSTSKPKNEPTNLNFEK